MHIKKKLSSFILYKFINKKTRSFFTNKQRVKFAWSILIGGYKDEYRNGSIKDID